MVINIIQAGMAQQHTLGLAAGNPADFQRIQRHFHRQAHAFRCFRWSRLFRRRRFALNMDVAGRQALDVQFFLPQLLRLPSEGEAGDIDVAARRFDAPLFAVEAFQECAMQGFGTDVHAKPARHFIQAETQAGFGGNQPSNQPGQHQNSQYKQQQDGAQPFAAAFFRRTRRGVGRQAGIGCEGGGAGRH